MLNKQKYHFVKEKCRAVFQSCSGLIKDVGLASATYAKVTM